MWSRRCRVGAALLAVVAAWVPAITHAQYPSTMTITGTIRDMSFMHRDFESPTASSYQQLGLLFNNLSSPLQMPMFVDYSQRNASAGTLLSTRTSTNPRTSQLALNDYSRHSYDEYYMNVPGVNIAYTVSIPMTLTNPSTGQYQFDSSANGGFFPLGSTLGYSSEMVSGQNFGFTTEYRVQFYYRGGEVFQFIGDDDLWVFIDNKLTPCDLGGIHPALTCSFPLNSLGLTVNTSYTMLVVHAERHTSASNFKMTTTILPANHAPVVYAGSVTINEGQCTEFGLASYITDEDLTDTVFNVRFLDNATMGYQPVNLDSNSLAIVGSSVPPLNVWEDAATTVYQFCGGTNWNGTVSLPFQANDTKDVSSNVANFSITLRPVNDPPVAYNGYLNTTQDDAALLYLNYSNIDPMPSDKICFRLVDPIPTLGNTYWVDQVNGILRYTGVLPGNDSISFVVNDRGLGCDPSLYSNITRDPSVIELGTGDSNTATVNVTVVALPVPSTSPEPTVSEAAPPPALPSEILQYNETSSASTTSNAGLTSGAIGGIVAGAVVAFVIGAVIVGAAIYWKFSASRLEAQWNEQFRSAHGQMNPLYSRQQTEGVNPLYSATGASTTIA